MSVWKEYELRHGRKRNLKKWNTISLAERQRFEALGIIDQLGYIFKSYKKIPYTVTRVHP